LLKISFPFNCFRVAGSAPISRALKNAGIKKNEESVTSFKKIADKNGAISNYNQ
jgi:hypothetical protein